MQSVFESIFYRDFSSQLPLSTCSKPELLLTKIMTERKKPATRFQGERPSKRRKSDSPPPKVKPKSISPVESDEELPTKLKEADPLPTTTTPQTLEYSSSHFQSIAERFVKLQIPTKNVLFMG